MRTILPLALAFAMAGCSVAPQGEEFNRAMAVYRTQRLPRQIAAAPAQAPARTSDAVEDIPNWLTLCQATAQPAQAGPATQSADNAAATAPGRSGGGYEHWSTRRGPAYPGDYWHSFGRDAKELLPIVWDDTKATATNGWALLGFGLAGAAGIAINGSGADNNVADHYSKHGSGLNTFWDSVGDVGGNPGAHFAVAGAAYFTSLACGDTKTYEVSKTMINALSITGLTTLALKGIVRTESPNGDEYGWPSGHASSSFCFATVMHEAYGPLVGVPLYGFATFVAYERVDARNHDFSDVVSGALIGMAIGHAVSQNHKPRIFGMDVVPYVDPEKGVGVAMIHRW